MSAYLFEPTVPIMTSMGGVPFNQPHIDYWKARALKAESERNRLRCFARDIMGMAWDAGDIIAEDAQTFGLKHGVIVRVDFDPERDEDIAGVCLQPGDDYYALAWSERVRDRSGEAVAAKTPSEGQEPAACFAGGTPVPSPLSQAEEK